MHEGSLIFRYWTYLESDAEKSYKFGEEVVHHSIKGIQGLDLSFLPDTSVHGEWLKERFEEEAVRLKTCFDSAEKVKNSLIRMIETESEVIVDEITIKPDIPSLISKIEAMVAGLDKESIDKHIQECTRVENEFIEKTKVIELIPMISSYIDSLRWDEKAEKSKIKTRAITNKQKELFEKYVTDDYVKTFQNECVKLCANFSVEVVSRASSGQALKKLQIKGVAPGKILREGEQRALSIAGFLTEVQMDERNTGIVLDDPVSSLDHKRRSSIAHRLLDESERRQVVIFTHDISFFMELKTEAEQRGISFRQETIRTIQNEPGHILTQIPWQGMSVKERTGKLKNDLQDMKALKNAGNEDDYFYKAKEWCELLRESWERAVEEILLCDAIQRYNPCVQTQKLRKAPFTNILYSEIERGMTECSAWCHDRARALNGDIQQGKVEFCNIDHQGWYNY